MLVSTLLCFYAVLKVLFFYPSASQVVFSGCIYSCVLIHNCIGILSHIIFVTSNFVTLNEGLGIPY